MWRCKRGEQSAAAAIEAASQLSPSHFPLQLPAAACRSNASRL